METVETRFIQNKKGKKEKKVLKLGIEPKTFALLARRSNQLSYSSSEIGKGIYYIEDRTLSFFSNSLMQNRKKRPSLFTDGEEFTEE